MSFFKKNSLTTLGLLLIGLVALPATVFIFQQQSDPRSKAATVCSTNVPADVSIIIDRSGSMNDKTSSGIFGGTKIAGAKTAANKFVDLLAQNSQNRVNLVTFASNGTLDNTLTNNFSSIKTKINAIYATGGTCIECGIKKANADIATAGRPNIKKVVVLLTDGKANFIDGNGSEQSTALSEQKALAAAIAGNSASGTIYFTIGLGNDVNTTFLQNLAAQAGGKYYFPPTTDSLTAIYTEISQIIAQGSVGGTVFNDTNKNGIFDQNEQKLSGWSVVLTPTSGSPITLTTDASGYYLFTGVCDGSYTLKSVLQSGWAQTHPGNSAAYPITITNGISISDKDFGVVKSARCSDTIDNDSNGFADTNDSTCHTDGNPKNSSSYDPNKDGEHGGGNTCADSKDNNGNNLIDGADPACHTDGDPTHPNTYDPNRPENPRCSDGIDNDNNSFTDTNDSSCHTDGNPNNSNSYVPTKDGEHGGGNTCSDGKDNNGNNLIDGADPACHTDGNPGNPTSYDPTRPENARCSDGIDNDSNGFADTNDSTCHTDGNPTNASSYVPNKDGEHGGANTCADSKDNNGNNMIDGADPVCHTDNNPNNPNSYDPNRPEGSNKTGLLLDLTLHGIGSGGDNASPLLNTLSNKNPIHATLSATVSIFDGDNQKVATASTTVTYSSTTGKYTGSVDITPGLPTGPYTVKIRIGQHLTRVVPGIQTLTLGTSNQLPSVALVAGDINNDNKLDILDYNLLLDCYSDLAPPVACY